MPNNLFTSLPDDLPEELVDCLVEHGDVRIERIVSTGQRSPEGFWYDQSQAEWVVLLRGAARLQYEDGQAVDLQPGDWENIPAHRRHRVDWTSESEPTVWLAVFYG